MGIVNQEVVITAKRPGFNAEVKYVFSLLEEVTLDNPAEITDRPAIDLVEVQSNRLIARTKTFRVKCAAGIYLVQKKWGNGPGIIYQEDKLAVARSRGGIPFDELDAVGVAHALNHVDEWAMVFQIEALKSLRNQLVTVYSVLEPNFRGFVQDIRFIKDNRSRTVTAADVVIREALSGSVSASQFSFLPIQQFDAARDIILQAPQKTVHVSSTRLTEPIHPDEPSIHSYSLARHLKNRLVPDNPAITPYPTTLTKFNVVSKEYDALRFEQKTSFLPTAAFIVSDFYGLIQWLTNYQLVTTYAGIGPYINIRYSSSAAPARWEFAADRNTVLGSAPTNVNLFSELAMLKPLYVKDFMSTKFASAAGPLRQKDLGSVNRIDAVLWLSDTIDGTPYRSTLNASRFDDPNAVFMEPTAPLPVPFAPNAANLNQIGSRFGIAVVVGSPTRP